MSLEFWAATDVGRSRAHNEDNFLVARKLNLFVVADGMGGHAAGEVASNVAVHEVHRVISEHVAILEAYRKKPGDNEKERVLELIEESILVACATVYRLAQDDPAKKGMGTTLSLLLVLGNRGFIGHVGDSRIYLLRNGSVLQLTEDHSLVNELIKRGKIRPDEVGQMPFKNAVTRAVGVYEKVEVDVFDLDVIRGDQYLLCSDGLSGYLEDDDETLASMAEGDIKEIPDQYIRYANEQGGKDNITAIFLRVTGAVGKVPEMVPAATASPHVNLLRLEPLFAHCPLGDLTKIAALATEHDLRANTLLIDVDGTLDGLYVCMQGKLQIDGDTRSLGRGDSIGMEALLGPIKFSRPVRVLEATRVLFISGDDLRSAMAEDAHFGWRLLFSLGEQQSRQIYALSETLRRLEDHNLTREESEYTPGFIAGSSGLRGGGKLALTALPDFLTTATGEADELPAVATVSEISDRPTVPRMKEAIGRGLNPK